MRHLLVLMLFKTSLLFLLLSVIFTFMHLADLFIRSDLHWIQSNFHKNGISQWLFLKLQKDLFCRVWSLSVHYELLYTKEKCTISSKFCFCFALKKKMGLEQHNFFCLMKTKQCRKWHTTLFQDGRICRINFAVQPDRLELGKPDGNDGWEMNTPVKCMENACMS